MKKILLLIFLICLSGSVFAESNNAAYRLGPGDKLTIGVWGHEDLQAEVVVLTDGTIYFPLIGQISVLGMTIPEAERKMTDELAVYVKEPRVSIVVTEMRTIEVKVLGEVKNPGIYQLRPGSVITDGLAAAGGPTTRAELAHVGIFTPNQPKPRIDISLGKRYKIQYKPDTVLPELLDGDTLYIPETKSPNWQLIFQYISGLSSLKYLTK